MDAAAGNSRLVTLHTEKCLGDIDRNFLRTANGIPRSALGEDMHVGSFGKLQESLVRKTWAGSQIDSIRRNQPNKWGRLFTSFLSLQFHREKTEEDKKKKNKLLADDHSFFFAVPAPVSGFAPAAPPAFGADPPAFGAAAPAFPAAGLAPAAPAGATAFASPGAAAAPSVPVAAAAAFSFFIRIFRCLTFGSPRIWDFSRSKRPFSCRIFTRSKRVSTERCLFIVSAVLKLEWIDIVIIPQKDA